PRRHLLTPRRCDLHSCIASSLDDSNFCIITAAPPSTYTLSLHDALPICERAPRDEDRHAPAEVELAEPLHEARDPAGRRVQPPLDRKSTRLNSSHVAISYAVFCLKKKKRSRFGRASRRRIE